MFISSLNVTVFCAYQVKPFLAQVSHRDYYRGISWTAFCMSLYVLYVCLYVCLFVSFYSILRCRPIVLYVCVSIIVLLCVCVCLFRYFDCLCVLHNMSDVCNVMLYKLCM